MPADEVVASLAYERQALVLADTHIAEGEWRIVRHTELLEEAMQRGEDTALALRALDLMNEALVQWRQHRALILDHIQRLEDQTKDLG